MKWMTNDTNRVACSFYHLCISLTWFSPWDTPCPPSPSPGGAPSVSLPRPEGEGRTSLNFQIKTDRIKVSIEIFLRYFFLLNLDDVGSWVFIKITNLALAPGNILWFLENTNSWKHFSILKWCSQESFLPTLQNFLMSKVVAGADVTSWPEGAIVQKLFKFSYPYQQMAAEKYRVGGKTIN